MKLADSNQNTELEESLMELGLRSGSSLPVVEDATATADEIMSDNDEDDNEENLPAELESPMTKLLSKYYSGSELANISKSITPEKATKLHQSLMNISTGAYSSIPRVCAGSQCKSAHACPFVASKLVTQFVGSKCPVEIMLVEEWRTQYYDLMKENDIDYSNIVVNNYINELIECDVISMRMNHYIGGKSENGGGEIVETVFVINPKTGDPESNDTQSVAFMVKAFVSTRREKAIQALMASPYWKAKFAKNDNNKDKDSTAEMLERARRVQKQRNSEEEIQDVTYSVINEGDEPVF